MEGFAMKSFQAGIFVVAMALLMPLTSVSVHAAEEGRGQNARQGGGHAVERSDRTVERQDERRAERTPRVIELREKQRAQNALRSIQQNDQGRGQQAPRTVEQRDQRRVQQTPRTIERHDQRRVQQAPRTVERHDQRRVQQAPRTIERHDQRRVQQAPRTVERHVTTNRQPGYVLDRRHRHDRYYPPRGHAVRQLPYGYRTFHHHGHRYYYRHGIWYRSSGVSFIVVTPPYGIIVPVLPPYYTTVWVGGFPYYYAGGVYYVWRPAMQGYVVSEPPAESNIDSEQAEPSQFYVYPKEGQDPEQQAQDRYECHRWAADQTGFDPSQPPAGATAAELSAKRGDYRRAIMACLEARGYSVK